MRLPIPLMIKTSRKFATNLPSKVVIRRVITKEDVESFVNITGDSNSVHTEQGVVHGALLNGFVSGVIGTKLPGPGTLVLEQQLKYPNKCFINDEVQITVELVENRKVMNVKYDCKVGTRVVFEGTAKLIQNK